MADKKPTKKESEAAAIPFDEQVKARAYKKKSALVGINPSMMVITSSFQTGQNAPIQPTFRLVPMTDSCPFKECYWLPTQKTFVIIDKNPVKVFQMFPKLTAAGGQATAKTKNDQGQNVTVYAQERLLIDDYHQHFLLDISEIDQFITAVAVNPDFDWMKFLKTK